MHSIMDCYVDADWAGNHVDRKSTTGYVIIIIWKLSLLEIKKTRSCDKVVYVCRVRSTFRDRQ